jgi:hypothetical protein
MLLGWWSISVTLTLSNQFNLQTFILLYNVEYVFGVALPTVGRFSLYKKRIVTIVAGAQPRTSCRSIFKQFEILLVPCQYILSLMNFRKIFKQIQLYTL